MVAASSMEGFKSEFLRMYEQEFGFVLKDREIVVNDARCLAIHFVRTLVQASPALYQCYFTDIFHVFPTFIGTGAHRSIQMIMRVHCSKVLQGCFVIVTLIL